MARKLIVRSLCIFLLVGIMLAAVCVFCMRRRPLPSGVTEIFITVSPDQAKEHMGLFRAEYIVQDEGYVTNVDPGPGVDCEVQLAFQGETIPLAVRSTGEICIPDKYFITWLPYGQTEVGQWRPGASAGISGTYGLYWFKRRSDELGLIFVLVPYEGESVWVYPADAAPLAIDGLPLTYSDSVGRSVRTVVIPDISGLLRIERGDANWTRLFPEPVAHQLEWELGRVK